MILVLATSASNGTSKRLATTLSLFVGTEVGDAVGRCTWVGLSVGVREGFMVGPTDGAAEGVNDGIIEGNAVGISLYIQGVCVREERVTNEMSTLV